VTFWRCDAEVSSSFVIFAVLVLQVVLAKRCKLLSILYSFDSVMTVHLYSF